MNQLGKGYKNRPNAQWIPWMNIVLLMNEIFYFITKGEGGGGNRVEQNQLWSHKMASGILYWHKAYLEQIF